MQETQAWQESQNLSTREKRRLEKPGRTGGTGGVTGFGGIGGIGGVGGNGGVRIVEHGVSSAFYADVLRAYVNLTGVLRFWAVSNLVLRHAREQLDPQRQGAAITIAHCLPPYEGKKVRSMYECMRVTTPAWENRREDQLFFLGANCWRATR